MLVRRLCMQDPAFLKAFLLDSIVTARLPLANLSAGATLTAASGKVLAITLVGGAPLHRLSTGPLQRRSISGHGASAPTRLFARLWGSRARHARGPCTACGPDLPPAALA